ncbi:hypothetical protein [Salipiger mucosus]|uniref:Thymidylate synthase n=1 Tax=Salipiger mucosus DSM 16094 TaxID=1123237 RepID=S9QJB2_9RHOB|nr:hypothetical protein [Salipiger mucosus]EPX79648.1 thymidylate synthase [Salipiger mucosus DSM 16094]
MYRYFMMLALAGVLAGCSSGGGGDNPLSEDEECVRENPLQECEEAEEEEEVVEEEEEGVPDDLAESLASFRLSEDKSTMSVSVVSVDTTPLEATYQRNTALDVRNDAGEIAYLAYSVQEDPLDRFFMALGNRSADGSVEATAVASGGQFGTVYHGSGYSRDGAYTPPTVGDGPGEGQVSYAGRYVSMLSLTGRDDTTADGDPVIILPVADGTPLAITPSQPAVIEGVIFLNANFAEATVEGIIFDRVAENPSPNPNLLDDDPSNDDQIPEGYNATRSFEDVDLYVSDIDENGEFLGEGSVNDQNVGSYGGIFGGEDAGHVAGVTNFNIENNSIEEIGAFVLTQCGLDGDDAVCDQAAPFE